MADDDYTSSAMVIGAEALRMPVDDIVDQRTRARRLRQTLVELQRLAHSPEGHDVPLYLMRIVFKLIDEQGKTLATCRLQHAIDTYLQQ